MTPPFHSSGISGKGENTSYGGEPVGYVIELKNGLKLYHADVSGYNTLPRGRNQNFWIAGWEMSRRTIAL
jgi:L-ascorbate metabolism protein UlaG (beta-lactamase superfamily)